MSDDTPEGDTLELDDAVTASTVEKQSNLKPWKKGQSGNLKGRPKGSRNKIIQTVHDIYTASLERHGEETLELVRQKDPSTYMRLAMQFIPSKVESLFDVSVRHEFSEEYAAAASFADAWRTIEKARQRIGASPMIDISPEAEHAWKTDGND
jgi:Family of unknown function (DUF5681)